MPPVAQIAWAIADVDSGFFVSRDPATQQWEVYNEQARHLLCAIDEPLFVQVAGALERLFGSTIGRDFSSLPDITPKYWQDVHVHTPAVGEKVAAKLAQLAAHLGVGTAVDHEPVLAHLGDPDTLLRPEWAL